ncbi:MAG: quinone-dependent dihydroorotate dehydrogenase [Patescibacteria group bacterium]
MSLYSRLIRPVLFWFDPEKIHTVVIWGLNLVSRLPLIAPLITRFCRVETPTLNTRLGELLIANPIGLSAGFDKYIAAPLAYQMLGFGFAELGSITNQPQPGNPKPRLWRLPADQGLIVHYGLNNDGAAVSAQRLLRASNRGISCGISIAVSAACSPAEMVGDYIAAWRKIWVVANYITFNVSCPNVTTQAVVQQVSFITTLLAAIRREMDGQFCTMPTFIKLGPDLPISDLDIILDAAMSNRITGIVATNLAKDRAKLKNIKSQPKQLDHPGGISGRLIRDISTEMIRHIDTYSRGRLTIIGVGGVFNAADAYAKIRAGASAVQIITGFIYGGPLTVRRINRELLQLLRRDGFDNITEAIGSDHRWTNKVS